MKIFKQWLWKWVFSYLTKPVMLEQVITVNDAGQVKVDGRILEPNELLALQQEIKAFQNFRLKTILFNTPKSLAYMQMFENSKNWDDMLAGKLTLYTISLQENAMMKILNAPQGNQVMMQSNPYKR